jgi:hypothetical protein
MLRKDRDSKGVDPWTAREDPCRSSLVISRDLIPTFLFSGLFFLMIELGNGNMYGVFRGLAPSLWGPFFAQHSAPTKYRTYVAHKIMSETEVCIRSTG